MKKFKHGGNIQAARKQLKTDKILDFSANINPLGLSYKIKKAIKQSSADIVHYPQAQSKKLKKVIAKYYQLKKSSVVVGNGATELFYTLCQLLAPKRALVLAPSFSEYKRASMAAGSKIKEILLSEKNGFEPDLAAIAPKLKKGDMLFLGNPNNPTGTIVNKNDLITLLQTVPSEAFIVIDESFIDFLPDCTDYSMKNLISQYKNLVIIHSMTKFFAIPGLRLGFGVFNKQLAKQMINALDCWNVNTLAQEAGICALADDKYIEKSRQYLIESKTKFLKKLEPIKELKLYSSPFNFILINIDKTNLTADEFCQKMFEQKTLVRNCSNFKALESGFVRIAVRTIEQNKLFVKRLKKILKEQK